MKRKTRKILHSNDDFTPKSIILIVAAAIALIIAVASAVLSFEIKPTDQPTVETMDQP